MGAQRPCSAVSPKSSLSQLLTASPGDLDDEEHDDDDHEDPDSDEDGHREDDAGDDGDGKLSLSQLLTALPGGPH